MSGSDHVLRNQELWTRYSRDYVEPGRLSWARPFITWGIWSAPESKVGILGLLDELAGKDVLELGCGTAYLSAWFARLGARPVGIDITSAQLATAKRFQIEFDLHFPLVRGNAE